MLIDVRIRVFFQFKKQARKSNRYFRIQKGGCLSPLIPVVLSKGVFGLFTPPPPGPPYAYDCNLTSKLRQELVDKISAQFCVEFGDFTRKKGDVRIH